MSVPLHVQQESRKGGKAEPVQKVKVLWISLTHTSVNDQSQQ